MADEIDGYVDRLYRWTRPAAILSDGNYRLTLGELQPFLLHDDDVPWRQAPLHKSHAVLYEPQAFRLTIPDLRVVIVITPQLLRLTDTPSMLVTVHPF